MSLSEKLSFNIPYISAAWFIVLMHRHILSTSSGIIWPTLRRVQDKWGLLRVGRCLVHEITLMSCYLIPTKECLRPIWKVENMQLSDWRSPPPPCLLISRAPIGADEWHHLTIRSAKEYDLEPLGLDRRLFKLPSNSKCSLWNRNCSWHQVTQAH